MIGWMNSRRMWSFGGGIVGFSFPFLFFGMCGWIGTYDYDITVNAGEVVQLVLKNPNTGAWLPFSFVLGVMIHELAHIKQMVRPSLLPIFTPCNRYLTFLSDNRTIQGPSGPSTTNSPGNSGSSGQKGIPAKASGRRGERYCQNSTHMISRWLRRICQSHFVVVASSITPPPPRLWDGE